MSKNKINKFDAKRLSELTIIDKLQNPKVKFCITQVNLKKKVVVAHNTIENRFGIARLHPNDKFDIVKGVALSIEYAEHKSHTEFRTYATQSFLKDIISHKSVEELMVKVALMDMYNLFGTKEHFEKIIEIKVIKQLCHLDMTVKEFNAMVNSKEEDKLFNIE